VKYWLIFIFFVVGLQFTFGQTPIGGTPVQQGGGQDRLNLVSASSGRINAKTGHMIFYRPVYEHKGSTLSADSGYIYEDEVKRQFFEAFGNVVITQPSGTVIYSDYLHYDAAAQNARLTNNVRMVDGMSTLTTNYLTYKMRSKVGTYTGGGRIISQGDTITSKNAHYFENTKDAYFRNKVVVRTPNVKIYTDTMRYNSAGRMTYFFGPTNIKDNTGEKNLYTERGHYNTGTGVADFNKNNLYTEGTKFLKGDSLHYERESGIGKAYRNVVFVDTLDKFYAYGGFGLYRQADESITMTEKPLIITLVKNDSTDNTAKIDSTENNAEVKSRRERRREQRELEKQEKLEADTDSIAATEAEITPPELKEEAKMDSVYLTADTLFSKVIPLKEYIALDLKLDRSGGELIVEDDVDYGDNDDSDLEGDSIDLDTDSAALTLNLDSGETVIDNLEKIDILEKTIPDSIQKNISLKPVIQTKKPVSNQKSEPLSIEATIKADSLMRQNAIIPTGSEADSLLNNALKVAQTQDTTTKIISAGDSTTINAASDTSRTRIVKAYYNVRLFKSDLQAVADSVYYGMADSMFRFMGRPMIWAQGSQISADTIFMQILSQQLDNALLKENAMMVNAVLDTVKFNQLKGRKITAFFANSNIDRLYVDGNAENLIFSEDAKLGIITDMFHDRGARIKIKMEGKKIIDYVTVRKVDQKVYPLKMVNQDNEILPGFIWRPQDRPTSKEDLLNRKREIPKAGEATEPPPTTERGTESAISRTDLIETVQEEISKEIEEVENNEKEKGTYQKTE
jgi:lipopolysaccharide export system protein LptA